MKVVWITMLAMADRDGVVWASVPGLAHRAGVGLGECRVALEKFLGPDLESRTTENEGRRIEAVDGGWRLLNHGKYRSMLSAQERREYNRVKQAEYRKRRREFRHEAGCNGAVEAIGDGLDEVREAKSSEGPGDQA